MGGQIGVQSRRGDGSTFWFTANLPVVINPSEPARTDPEALSGIRVLVVDDNETNREILLRQLKYWNVEVVTSSGAAEAIEILQDPSNRRFDIVLLDYFMPETDGLELAAAIRSRPDFGNPGLIMLSSAGPEFNSATVREFGIDLYLSKPVRRQDLQASIVRVLEGLDDADYDLFSVITAKHVTKASLGLNVLLVEDIAVNLQVAQHMLASIGCRSAAAGNGQEALDLMERNDFDLVLMDCQMPVMDGFTATREQRAREQGTGKRLPIIALTANALEEDRQHCIDAGMDDFISKPFNRETLIDVLSRWGAAEAPTTDQVTGDTEATAAYGAIERATLEQIADLDPDNGGVLVGRIIDTYLQDSAALVEQLAAATRNGDAAEAARIAHALKSSSANVGAKRLSGMCRTIEAGARSGRLETIAVEFSKASDEYDTVVVELRQTKDELVA
jgi:CheY-like chemotaxis protein/HPt (histidine-containing phosphotransfer) domain-containing protein